MNKTIVSVISCVGIMFSSGCATGPSVSKISGAVATIGQAAEYYGLMTYEQIQEMKRLAKEAEASIAEPTCGTDVVITQPTTGAQVPQTDIIPQDGKAVTVILGNTKTCGLTRSFLAMKPEVGIETALPWVDVIYLDYVQNRNEFDKYRPKGGFLFPLVRCFDKNGVFKGEFVARRTTIAAVIKQVGELCPDIKE